MVARRANTGETRYGELLGELASGQGQERQSNGGLAIDVWRSDVHWRQHMAEATGSCGGQNSRVAWAAVMGDREATASE